MEQFQVLIIGGGTAGITVAAQLLKKDPTLRLGIIEPSEEHYYQPAWTLVGAGTFDYAATVKKEQKFIPKGAHWIKDYAQEIDAKHNLVKTRDGSSLKYDYLVVAVGVQYDWKAIPGLKESIGKGGVTTNYDKRYVKYTWELLQNFKGGNALFTQPHTPIKCGGAPQKIMYLAEHYFRKQGVRDKTNVIFATPGSVIFGVQPFKKFLEGIIKDRKIFARFLHKLVEIRPVQREAVYQVTNLEGRQLTEEDIDKNIGMRLEGTDKVVIPYEMIHLAPPQSAPDFIKSSPLAKADDPYGWVDVDKNSLQHVRYPNVFSLGDVAGTPNAKTGAAVRKQAPIVVNNLMSLMKKHPLNGAAGYDGYSSCPIVTGYGKMLLAEFNYENKATPSLPIDTSKSRWSMWILKKYILPWFYWHRMLKGKG
ncbi:MAG: NAD(P)/FAD-dependent oxidoreductase [Cyclobacteriaceae bacterium]|nr:NAD(P)/FAD-dependent oxidoreductase [Cyclobacteriaceae bacterium]